MPTWPWAWCPGTWAALILWLLLTLQPAVPRLTPEGTGGGGEAVLAPPGGLSENSEAVPYFGSVTLLDMDAQLARLFLLDSAVSSFLGKKWGH